MHHCNIVAQIPESECSVHGFQVVSGIDHVIWKSKPCSMQPPQKVYMGFEDDSEEDQFGALQMTREKVSLRCMDDRMWSGQKSLWESFQVVKIDIRSKNQRQGCNSSKNWQELTRIHHWVRLPRGDRSAWAILLWSDLWRAHRSCAADSLLKHRLSWCLTASPSRLPTHSLWMIFSTTWLHDCILTSSYMKWYKTFST